MPIWNAYIECEFYRINQLKPDTCAGYLDGRTTNLRVFCYTLFFLRETTYKKLYLLHRKFLGE
jgi:hypothetical protein